MVRGRLLGDNQPDIETSKCEPNEVDSWREAASLVDVTLFESKALYVIAMTRQLAEASILCLDDPRPRRGSMELPAYVLLADAIETLGRCLTGCREEKSGSGTRMKAGLERLLGRCGGTIKTRFGRYDVKACKNLRNFTTHGGTTPDRQGRDVLDGELTRQLINLLGNELTDYWRRLGQDGDPSCAPLANALIRPLLSRGECVFVRDMYRLISHEGATAGAGIAI